MLALGAAHETLLRGLEPVLPRGRAAALLTCGYAKAAAPSPSRPGAMEEEAGQLERDHGDLPEAPGTPGEPGEPGSAGNGTGGTQG